MGEAQVVSASVARARRAWHRSAFELSLLVGRCGAFASEESRIVFQALLGYDVRGEAAPSQKALAEELSLRDERVVRGAIDEAERLGLLRIVSRAKGRTPAEYALEHVVLAAWLDSGSFVAKALSGIIRPASVDGQALTGNEGLATARSQTPGDGLRDGSLRSKHNYPPTPHDGIAANEPMAAEDQAWVEQRTARMLQDLSFRAGFNPTAYQRQVIVPGYAADARVTLEAWREACERCGSGSKRWNFFQGCLRNVLTERAEGPSPPPTPGETDHEEAERGGENR